MSTTVFLVRHGHYMSPQTVAPYRLPDFHLSEQGKADARRLSEELSREQLVAVYTSRMERTQETAVIVAAPHNLTPIADERLLEVRSPLQGKTIEEIHALGGWTFQIYDTEWYQAQGGETLDDIVSRMRDCIEQMRATYEGKAVCLVSHGDPIMLAAAYYSGRTIDVEHLLAMEPYVPMAGGYRLVFSEAKIQGVYPIVS